MFKPLLSKECVEIQSFLSRRPPEGVQYIVFKAGGETPPHYILEYSNFGFNYVRLCNLDIPREK